MLRTALLLLCLGATLGSELQAWKAIWDHWQLGRELPEDCRAEPCLEKCAGEYDKYEYEHERTPNMVETVSNI